MKKQVLFNDLKVVLKRGPLVDKTNVLEMPKTSSEIKKTSRKEDVAVDRIVPYDKSSHSNNNENTQVKGMVKDISVNHDIVLTRRTRKASSRCPCCTTVQSSESKNVSGTNTPSRKSIEQSKSANEQVKSKTCHDMQFNLPCRIILERVNIEKLSKRGHTNRQADNEINASIPKSQVSTRKRIQEPSENVKNLKKLSTSVPAKSLRQQIKPNYVETTINTSKEQTLPDTKQICATKVPVYRQNVDTKRIKKPDNLYEFDESDSDRSRGQGTGKCLAKSKKLDGSLYSLPQKCNAKRAKAKTTRKNKPVKVRGPARKYDDILQGIIKKVMEKVSHEPKNVEDVKDKPLALPKQTGGSDTLKTGAPKTILPQNKIREINIKESVKPSVQRISKVLVDISPHNIVQKCVTIKKTGENEIAKQVEENVARSEFEITTKVRENQSVIEGVPENNKENVPPEHNIPPASLHDSEQINENFNNEFGAGTSETNKENIPQFIDESFNDNDVSEQEDNLDESFLDFGMVHSTPIKSRVNIISDVLLQKTNRTPPSPKRNPWRFNQAVTRNPHFIILKTTALPCLKQDMVLDHNQVEKMEEHFSKTPRKVDTPRKSPVQKSILEYVTSPERHNQENVPRSSLFDYEDFSPIKGKTPLKNELNKAKRNILGAIQDNAANIAPITSTPKNKDTIRVPLIEHDEDEDIANCFGFVDADTISKDQDRPSEARPFRIKEYKKQQKRVAASVKIVDDLPVEEPVESLIAGDGVEGQIFEDPELAFSMMVPSKIYIRKPRRKRLKSVDVENEGEHHPKKRKKDMMTKAEEAALEDWAAKFNSMCREVEKHDLEIE